MTTEKLWTVRQPQVELRSRCGWLKLAKLAQAPRYVGMQSRSKLPTPSNALTDVNLNLNASLCSRRSLSVANFRRKYKAENLEG